MATLRLACAAALAATLTVSGASATEVGAEVDLLELHADSNEANVAIDSTFELRDDSWGVVVKAAGNGDVGPSMDELETQVLALKQLAPSTALLVGVRHDWRPGNDLSHASAALTHDFADWLSGEIFAFVSEDGDLTGSGEVVAAFGFAERLTLEPRVGFVWSAQDVVHEGFASGFTELSASARLRRELSGNLDAYVGVIHERLLSDTRAMARAAGESVQSTRGIVGIGLRF
jgi:copper resistance protein B